MELKKGVYLNIGHGNSVRVATGLQFCVFAKDNTMGEMLMRKRIRMIFILYFPRKMWGRILIPFFKSNPLSEAEISVNRRLVIEVQ